MRPINIPRVFTSSKSMSARTFETGVVNNFKVTGDLSEFHRLIGPAANWIRNASARRGATPVYNTAQSVIDNFINENRN